MATASNQGGLIRNVGRGPAVALALWALLVASLHFLSKEKEAIPAACNQKRITGVPCPTCGGTRATFALVKGNVLEAIAFNPWIVMVHFLILLALLGWVLKRPKLNIFTYLLRRPKLTIVVLLGSLAANWIYVLKAGV